MRLRCTIAYLMCSVGMLVPWGSITLQRFLRRAGWLLIGLDIMWRYWLGWGIVVDIRLWMRLWLRLRLRLRGWWWWLLFGSLIHWPLRNIVVRLGRLSWLVLAWPFLLLRWFGCWFLWHIVTNRSWFWFWCLGFLRWWRWWFLFWSRWWRCRSLIDCLFRLLLIVGLLGSLVGWPRC